jgi:Zn finger protein HypA/HybF involved in hydrogenase expression
MVWATIAIVAAIGVMSVGLAIVEFRKLAPLIFECQRCRRRFRRAPHLELAASCPHCGATDWNR